MKAVATLLASLALVSVVASLLVLLLAAWAYAHDSAHHELDGWYQSLQTSNGYSCCSREDCKVVPYGADGRSDAWIDPARGTWRVRIDPRLFPGGKGEVFDAPPETYAKQAVGHERRVAPNPTDGVVVCWHRWLGLRCVIPPPEF